MEALTEMAIIAIVALTCINFLMLIILNTGIRSKLKDYASWLSGLTEKAAEYQKSISHHREWLGEVQKQLFQAGIDNEKLNQQLKDTRTAVENLKLGLKALKDKNQLR